MASWFVYILFCDGKTFYVGITDNLKRRFFQHKNKYSTFTKKFSHIELAYSERFFTRGEAKNREERLRGWSVAKKKALIAGDKNLLIKLSKCTGFVEV
jgi:predicted GIY-YIG superfamily endonuclease